MTAKCKFHLLDCSKGQNKVYSIATIKMLRFYTTFCGYEMNETKSVVNVNELSVHMCYASYLGEQ